MLSMGDRHSKRNPLKLCHDGNACIRLSASGSVRQFLRIAPPGHG